MTKALLAFGLAITCIGPAWAESDIEHVKSVFKAPRRDWSKLPWVEHAEDLKPLGERAWPALSALLTDYEHGYDASETMLALDPAKAGPIIFSAMPVKNANVHGRTFKFFLRELEQGKPPPFSKDIYDAALRCLKSNETGSTEALYILGYVGTKSDIPTIRAFTKGSRRVAAESALGKLGDEQVLKALQNRLSKPVPNKISDEQAVSLSTTMDSAGFSRDKRFIPLLCRHLNDPIPKRDYDVIAAVPSWSAAIALDQIVNNTPTVMRRSLANPKEWCAQIEKR